MATIPSSLLSYCGVSRAEPAPPTRRSLLFVVAVNNEPHVIAHHGDIVALAALRQLKERVTHGMPVQSLGMVDGRLVLSLPESHHSSIENFRGLIEQRLAKPVQIGSTDVALDVRVGISPPGPGTACERISRAGAALTWTDGRRRVVVDDDALAQEIARYDDLSARIEGLLRGGHLTLAFQPIRRLDRGEIVAVEALARLEDPAGGQLTPGQFLPTIERLGLHPLLVEQVIGQAYAQIAEWRRILPGLRISVNLRADDLIEPSLSEIIAISAQNAAVDPSALIVEIIETHLANPHVIAGAVETLHDMGVSIAVDDFGTGFSSVSQLRSLRADIVKIDGHFAAGLADNDPVGGVVELAITLAESLGLMVICEGIEEADQVLALRQLQCPYGQGYLLGVPGPAAVIEPLLALSIPD